MLTRLIPSRLLSGLTALLIACGGAGGGAGNVSAPSTPSLSGVAAIGMALAKASVTLKDSTGKTETTTTDESGNFNFNNVSSLHACRTNQHEGSHKKRRDDSGVQHSLSPRNRGGTAQL